MKILAVDDEHSILELLPMLAARVGFPDMTTAASGPLALEAIVAAETPFDCLVLDINMPGMDGIDLCRRLRRTEAYSRTPIVMLTAMSEREYMDRAFRAGATDYITKPFDLAELGARLRVIQELVTARREVETARAGLADAAEGADDLAAGGVGNLVDLVSLTNYLRQGSRAGMAASQVIAVQIDRIGELRTRASDAEFDYALRDVAEAVNAVMLTRVGLMAYAQEGVFVVVSNDPAALPSAEIEAEVQYLLDERNAEFDDGRPMDLEVSIGNPIQPAFGDLADAAKSVERAMARAAARSVARRDAPPPRSFRQIGG